MERLDSETLGIDLGLLLSLKTQDEDSTLGPAWANFAHRYRAIYFSCFGADTL